MRSLILGLLISAFTLPALAACTDLMRRESMMFPGYKTFSVPLPMPDIAYVRPDGDVGKLAELRGRPSLVSFWWPRCPGCRAEGPSLNAMLDTYKPRGDMNFLALSVQGEQSEVTAYLARNSYASMDANVDPGAAIFRELCLMATPVHAVLNAEAEMVAIFVGPEDWTSEKMTLFLDTLIATGGV